MTEEPAQTSLGKLVMLPFAWARQLYDWVESLASHRRSAWVLFALAFCESVFFPIPPDVLLIPMGVAKPKRVFWFATLCLAGSISGALVGYWIGATTMATVGHAIIHFYHLETGVAKLNAWYRIYGAWVVLIAGFSPIPYKLFTLTSGALHMSLPIFVVASIIGRGGRFFLVALIIAIAGERAAAWIDRNFNTLTVIFTILLVGALLWSTM